MPHVLGNDIVGEIEAVGAAVRHLKPGDKTLVLPTLSCGTCPACLAGDDHLCRHYDVIGRRRNGGYAERVAVPAVNCLPYPDESPVGAGRGGAAGVPDRVAHAGGPRASCGPARTCW